MTATNGFTMEQHSDTEVRTTSDIDMSGDPCTENTNMSVQERAEKRRQSGRPFGALMLRLTEEQKALLEYVSRQERISMQKLVEVPIMEMYEEQHGLAFDEHRRTELTDMDVNRYTYKVSWSVDDQQYVAEVAEFPSLSWMASDRQSAYNGIHNAVADAVAKLESAEEDLPIPLTEREFPSTIEIPSPLYRDLAVKAWRQGVSVSTLVSDKFDSH